VPGGLYFGLLVYRISTAFHSGTFPKLRKLVATIEFADVGSMTVRCVHVSPASWYDAFSSKWRACSSHAPASAIRLVFVLAMRVASY
jgi:hypothetical protein